MNAVILQENFLKCTENYKKEDICHLFIIIGKNGCNIVSSNRETAETDNVIHQPQFYADYHRISMQLSMWNLTAPELHR